MGPCNDSIALSDCTLATCCIQDQGFLDYLPSIAGNATYLGIFAILGVLQLGLGIRYKTWGFCFAMVVGCSLECLGYGGRIKMHDNIFDQNAFVMYMTPTVIAPAFICAGIYLCLSRIVTVYGNGLSRVKPVTYTITFISCDIFSLLLQSAGGAITASSDDPKTVDTGLKVLIAGLVFQVLSILLFMATGADFAWRVRKYQGEPEHRFAGLQQSTRWRLFLISLSVGVFTIFIRCVFRSVEFAKGFDSSIANNEAAFMVLEGPMVIITVLGLGVFHPGFAFRGEWAAAGWSFRRSKQIVDAGEQEVNCVDISRQQRTPKYTLGGTFVST